MKLIGFGASSVQGAVDSQGGFLRRLAAKLSQNGEPTICINHGIGGQTTRDMLVRLPRAKAHLPCRAVVLLGSNDFPRTHDDFPEHRVELPEFAANVETILSALASPETIFVSPFLVCEKRTGIAPETFAKYVTASLQIAAALKMTTWDLHAESVATHGKYLADDGLHFGDEGHEMIAERLHGMFQSIAQK